MKNLKFILMLLVGMLTVSMSLTSCNNDIEDNSVSEADLATLKTKMVGNYRGKTRFYYPKGYAMYGNMVYQKYDSLETSWNVRNDGTVTTEFPIHMLDSAIYVSKDYETTDDGKKYIALQKAISNLEQTAPMKTMQVKCNLTHPNAWWSGTNGVGFYVQPDAIKVNLEFNGSNHDVYFVFATNVGLYQFATNDILNINSMFVFQSNLYGICIDEMSEKNLIPSIYMRNVLFTCMK